MGRQVPAPLHAWVVGALFAQSAGAHSVPAAYLWQAPLPSQKPSVPQPAEPLSAHWPNGSCIAGTLAHVPADPDSAHDLQVPEQSLEQQTPCAQMFEAQSLLAVQVPPGGSFPQLFIVHLLPDVQSTSIVQLVRHWPLPPHKEVTQFGY